MAFIHKQSCECTKSELDLFSIPATQTSIVKGNWIQYHPLTNIIENGPIEFNIEGTMNNYIDLSNSMLHVRAQIMDSQGQPLNNDSPVGPINLFLQSLFSEVDVTLNDRLISNSSNLYPFRAFFESVLSYGDSAKNSHLTEGLFYKDTAGCMDTANPLAEDNTNEGLKKRFEYTKGSRLIDLMGPIHADLFFQERLLLNGVSLKLKLHRSKNSFCLMTSNPNGAYKVVIQDASLYVRRVKVSPTVVLAHAKTLEHATAKYPLQRVQMKTFSIPQGNQSFTRENLFLGPAPKRIVLGFVDNSAYNGDYGQNPFNFKHNNLNFLALHIDGEQLPWKPLKPKFSGTDSSYMIAYQTLFSGTNNLFKDKGNDISRSDYADGYTLFAFDLSPDLSCGDHLNLIHNGNVRLEIQFAQPLDKTINVILFAEHESLLEVDKSRNIIADFGN